MFFTALVVLLVFAFFLVLPQIVEHLVIKKHISDDL